MGNAVTAFIAGAVPAVATWMPFDGSIAKSAPDAVKIADASQFADAAILNGWSARNELHRRRTAAPLRPGLAAGERGAGQRPQEILTELQPSATRSSPGAAAGPVRGRHWRTAEDWATRYRDGSVERSSTRSPPSTWRSARSPIRCPPQPTSTRACSRTCWRRAEPMQRRTDMQRRASGRPIEPSGLQVEPLAPALGAEISGVDLSARCRPRGRADPRGLRRPRRGLLPRPAPDARAAHRLRRALRRRSTSTASSARSTAIRRSPRCARKRSTRRTSAATGTPTTATTRFRRSARSCWRTRCRGRRRHGVRQHVRGLRRAVGRPEGDALGGCARCIPAGTSSAKGQQRGASAISPPVSATPNWRSRMRSIRW